MKLTKRANYLLIIGFLVILNVAFRFPITPHEIGGDSFQMHGMANFISANGYAKWIMHPFSFFGLYPFSYPSAGIFYLSSTSQCTGIDTEHAILLISILLGVLGAFTTYLMAKEILNDDFFAFATAFVFSTTRIFGGFTLWTYSQRGFFLALLPLFIWSLLRLSNSEQKGKLKYIMFALILFIMLGATHHVVFFIPVVLIAYFITILFNGIKQKFESPFIAKKIIPPAFFALFIALFLTQFAGFSFYNQAYHGFQRGYFFQAEFYTILLNLGIRYAMQIGVLIILMPIGVVSLVFKSNKRLPEIFLLILLLCFAPFLMDCRYVGLFLTPVYSVFISLGLIAIPKAISKVKVAEKIIIPILLTVLLFSAFLPSFVVVEEKPTPSGYTGYMTERTYNAGLFMKNYGNGSTISNAGFLALRMRAISGALTFEDPDKYDFSTLKRLPLSVILSKNLDMPYVIQDCYFSHVNYYGSLHRNVVMSKRSDNALVMKVLIGDNIHYAVTNDYYPTKWHNSGSGKFEDSPFLVSVQKKKYKVYGDSLESIWYLGKGGEL